MHVHASPSRRLKPRNCRTCTMLTLTVHVVSCEMSDARAAWRVMVMPDGQAAIETGVAPIDRPAENCDSWLTEK